MQASCIYTYTPHTPICMRVDSGNTDTHLFQKSYVFISLNILLYLCSSEFHFWLWPGRVWRLFISLLSLGLKMSNEEIQKHVLSECRQLVNQLLHYYFALVCHLLQ